MKLIVREKKVEKKTKLARTEKENIENLTATDNQKLMKDEVKIKQ